MDMRLKGGGRRAAGSGFTLIELLVVIAVIASLIAILVPCLQSARSQAGAAACQARLRQWGLTFKMYTDDNQGSWFPLWYAADSRMPLVGGEGWLRATTSYWLSTAKGCRVVDNGPSGSQRIMRSPALCPITGANKPYPCRAHITALDRGGAMLADAQSWWTGKFVLTSYGFNRWLCPDQTGSTPSAWGTANVKGCANIPVLGDGASCAPSYEVGPPGEPDLPASNKKWTIWTNFCIDRHRGGINMLFMDWSVRKVGLKELWTLKWHRDFDTTGKWTKAGGIQPEDWPQWMRGFGDY